MGMKTNNQEDNNSKPTKSLEYPLDFIIRFIYGYATMLDKFPDEDLNEDFKMGWISCIDRITKDLEGVELGINKLPTKEEINKVLRESK